MRARLHTVKVKSSSINCPCCSAKINLIQHKGHGATYARDWKSLSLEQVLFLEIWANSKHKLAYMDKNTVYEIFLSQMIKGKMKGFINRVPFNGRISELVSAGTDYGSSLIEKIPAKDHEKLMAKGPFYKIRLPRVRHVLKRGGILN
jgi:hypothetical protein